MSFGVLTLATPHDYRKAIGLALSVRVSNPGVPVAVACHPRLRSLMAPYFDHVVDEEPGLRGFVHKVHLDRYSPFQDTFFFDSDVLVFRDLMPIVREWNDQPYNACGTYLRNGTSTFGLDRERVMAILGKSKLIEIGGAGHAYFRKPGCVDVFDHAREIASDYRRYAGDITFADEDCMNIVLTARGLRPREPWGFFASSFSPARGTLAMDATVGRCEMIEQSSGKPLRPYMMHFVANTAPFLYAGQLVRLYRKFGADPAGLYRAAFADFWELEVEWRGKAIIKRALGIGARKQAAG
jgi:hypothetical protein